MVTVFVGGLMLALNGMALNLSLSANYFGVIDREGFATLALSGVERRYILLSANLAIFLLATLVQVFPVVMLGVLWRDPLMALLLFYLGLCLQVSGFPIYNAASIIGPYRMELKFSSQNRMGNLWGMLAWALSLPPLAILVGLPLLVWRPALYATLPLCALYAVGLYALTLGPLARWLQRREHAILAAVTSD